MKWFQRHLNWTYVLVNLSLSLVVWVEWELRLVSWLCHVANSWLGYHPEGAKFMVDSAGPRMLSAVADYEPEPLSKWLKKRGASALRTMKFRLGIMITCIFLLYVVALAAISLIRGSESVADSFVWVIFPPIIVPMLAKGTGAMLFSDAALILGFALIGWAWVLRKKHRSYAWLILAALFPLGWTPIVFLNEVQNE